ncbi:heavy-metal-associated domain-containing protein [Brevibacterium luteolum]|uniref:heavy-metal-associated domain-containing protein n=1 Tax=Brevibacterium luteolum TaxID=199591 RepID=UPI001C236B56|nr:heavy metal-associated domain-containing protein [Brevibacterium luteolum]MBU8577625.1 heavy-metal-associated domain-containing protein [Brevibacterium luteolum]
MSNTTYVVEGMTCGSCAGKVTDRVEQIPGVTDVDVDIATGGVTLTTDAPVSDETVKQAIEEIGYKVAAA